MSSLTSWASLNTLPTNAASLQSQYNADYSNMASLAENPEYTGVSTSGEALALEDVGLNPADYGLGSSTGADDAMSLDNADGYMGGVSDSYIDGLLGVPSGTNLLDYGMQTALSDPSSSAAYEVQQYDSLETNPSASASSTSTATSAYSPTYASYYPTTSSDYPEYSALVEPYEDEAEPTTTQSSSNRGMMEMMMMMMLTLVAVLAQTTSSSSSKSSSTSSSSNTTT